MSLLRNTSSRLITEPLTRLIKASCDYAYSKLPVDSQAIPVRDSSTHSIMRRWMRSGLTLRISSSKGSNWSSTVVTLRRSTPTSRFYHELALKLRWSMGDQGAEIGIWQYSSSKRTSYPVWYFNIRLETSPSNSLPRLKCYLQLSRTGGLTSGSASTDYGDPTNIVRS